MTTAEQRPPATIPSLQCPRCQATLPPVALGSQIIRCGSCGAAMEVRVRATPTVQAPVVSAPPVESPEPVRPRRKPMVEVAGPRHAHPVPTITVDLPLGPEAAPAPKPPPLTLTSVDVPWYAEDIERLPEANVDLGQLSLDAFETLPPLPLRLDIPQPARTGTAPTRSPGAPATWLQGK